MTMHSWRVAVLAPVGTGDYNDRLLKAIEPVRPPDVAVDVFNLDPDRAHPCIQGRLDLQKNGLAVVDRAVALEKAGYHGIWVSDFDMCGVEAAREVVDIPIIGGFPTSAFTALGLSGSFSIITILPATVAMQKTHIATYGLHSGFASIRSIDCPVCDLDTPRALELVYQEALNAIRQDGAQSILLGCTGFLDVAAVVSRKLSETLRVYVPVIDPNQAGFGFLVSLVRMGLRPSRVTYAASNT